LPPGLEGGPAPSENRNLLNRFTHLDNDCCAGDPFSRASFLGSEFDSVAPVGSFYHPAIGVLGFEFGVGGSDVPALYTTRPSVAQWLFTYELLTKCYTFRRSDGCLI